MLSIAEHEIDCQCPRADHVHGTYTMYVVHRCRCDSCRTSAATRKRERNREQLYGRYHLVPADPARNHVRSLMSQGMGWKRVAEVANVSTSTLYPILYGKGGSNPKEHRPPRKQIRKDISEKLLAVELDLLPGALVDDLGARRRLQALVAIGWSQHRLAPMLGMLPSNFPLLIHGRCSKITKRKAQDVSDLFDRLWDQEPAAETRFEQAGITRAKKYAEEHGWAPAAAWDDIDDPYEKPKHDLKDNIDPRSRGAIEKVDRLELVILDGYGDNDDTYIRAGWSSRMSGWAVLRRMNRLDLIDRLRRNDLDREIAS